MKKRIIAAALCLIVILGMTTAAAAANRQDPEELQPLWVHVANITLSMSCSDGSLTWSGLVQGQPDVTGVTAARVHAGEAKAQRQLYGSGHMARVQHRFHGSCQFGFGRRRAWDLQADRDGGGDDYERRD